MFLDSPDAPLETGLFTYKLVAYAGEGWESQASIPPTNMRIFQYPNAMATEFQHFLELLSSLKPSTTNSLTDHCIGGWSIPSVTGLRIDWCATFTLRNVS